MKLKKIIASLVTVMTMASSATAIASCAEDFEAVTEEVAISAQVVGQLEELENEGTISTEEANASLKVVEQIEELYKSGEISDQELQYLQETLINAVADSDSEPAEYVAYNKRVSNAIAPTQHYLAVLNGSKAISTNQTLQISFYLNSNVLDGYSDKSNYKYDKSLLTLSSIASSTATNSSRQIRTTWNPLDEIITIPANQAFMCYILPTTSTLVDDKGIASEYTLDCKTSMNDSPSNSIVVNQSGISMVKCIYALGDVNRDGKVTTEDSGLVMKYIVKLMVEANRSTSNYDKLAFELAGDFKEDGGIDILDVIAINNWINANS
ncbi:MAG: hypothetical protein K2K06_03745 [Oscillospiraceae bacterium]|nr:hypothetical protein [Oscillospiraceae bacterium]